MSPSSPNPDTLLATDEVQSGPRGSNQSGMREHNQRLVLSLVRQHGALAKSDIARRTRLSAQTVSVIMRELEAEGLLVKGEPVRGKVGQPSVPMSLAPEGAYFFGLQIGRRSAELVLIDFLGAIRARKRVTHRFPTPDGMVSFTLDAMKELAADLPAGGAQRIAGLGIAMPFQIWDWAKTIGVDPSEMEPWRHRKIRDDLADLLDIPVYLQNDATAACAAELVFGAEPVHGTFVHFYVAYFIGGGVVINGALHAGTTGNAGALGSMPVPGPDGMVQLLDLASLSGIAAAMERAGHDPQALWSGPDTWSVDETILADWVRDAARGLAHAIVAASSVLDFDRAMIDGWVPASLRKRLVEATQTALGELTSTGLNLPIIVEGTLGADARQLGAASLPLSERFLLDGNSAMIQA